MSLPDPRQFEPGFQIDIVTVEDGITIKVRAYANVINWRRIDSGAIIGVVGTVPPNVIVPPGITGATLKGFVLTAVPGVWGGNPPPTFSFQWLANDVEIPGATGSTYLLTAAEIGKVIKVRVTGTNSAGTAAATSAGTLPIIDDVPPVAPGNTSLPVISGSAVVGQTLSATAGVWTGEPVPSFSYQWKANGANVPGETGTTFLLTSPRVGAVITVAVTATNASGSATATSLPTAAVTDVEAPPPPPPPEGEAPANVVAPALSSSSITLGDTLTVTTGTWTGDPVPTFSYQWFADGGAIFGAIQQQLTVTADHLQKKLRCEVTATNTAGASTTTSGTTGKVANTVGFNKRYIRPSATGTGTGTSWDNAGSLNNLAGFIAAVGADGMVLLRADEGTYSASLKSVSAGGTAGHPVVIKGVDVNEDPMMAVIVGNRSEPWTAGSTAGPEVIRLLAGASNLTFQFLEFHRCGSGCFRFGDAVSNVTIENCKADNVNRFIENLITGVATTATMTNVRVMNCEARGFSRAFARVQYDSNGGLFYNCLGDSERQDGDSFAVGINFLGTAHDILVVDCEMRNCIDTRGGDQNLYWNADGYSSENGNHDITFLRCRAFGCTDGGFDTKGTNINYTDCLAGDNKRNFRLWGTHTLTNCTSLDPLKEGGLPSQDHIWQDLDASATVTNCKLADKSPATIAFALDGLATVLNVVNTSVQIDPAATLVENPNGGTVVIATTAGPVATIAPQISGLAQAGVTLTVSNGTWNTTGLTFTYRWTRDGRYIDDAEGSSYTLQAADVGRLISCHVYALTATNRLGEGTAVAIGPIDAQPPLNTVAPTITGIPFQGASLTANNGTWSGLPAPTFTYQWLQNGNPIALATSQTYTVQAGDIGANISVTVTGTNSSGSDDATSASVGPIQATATSLFVRKVAHGSGDGSDFNNAIALKDIHGAFNALGAGAFVNVLASDGPYTLTSLLSLSNGGAPGNPITVRGVDSGLNAAMCEIQGGRTLWNPVADPEAVYDVRTWDIGTIIWSLGTGASYLAFRNFHFNRCGDGCFRNGVANTDITIEDCTFFNVKRFFEMTAECNNVTIRNVTGDGFSECFLRIRHDSHNWLVEDCIADSHRQDGDNFAEGIQIDDTAHDLVFRNVVVTRCHDEILNTSGDYWNGDAFAAERGNYNITFDNCTGSGCTDGGFDCKAQNVTWINCVAEDNKRNWRLWGFDGMSLDGCQSRNPKKRGGTGGQAHFFIIGAADPSGNLSVGPDLTIKNSTAIQPSGAAAAFVQEVGHERQTILREFGNTFTNTTNTLTAAANCLFLHGTPGDTTPPTITSTNTVNVFSKQSNLLQLTASKPVSWRISGGADAALFKILDNANNETEVGSKLIFPATEHNGTDDTYVVEVEAKDANSNVSTQTITYTVQAGAPPFAFQSKFNGADNQTSALAADVGGVNITFTSGAKLSASSPLEGATSLLLTGGTQRATCSDNDIFWLGNAEFSILALINISAFTAPNYNCICAQLNSSGNQRAYRFGVTTTGQLDLVYSFNGQDTSSIRSTNGLIAAATTYEVAVDRDSAGTMRLYIDGVMVTKKTGAGGQILNSTTVFSIGNDNANNEGFVGKIDNLRLWKNYAFCGSDAGYTP